MKKKFSYREWHYTNADESLFNLRKDELEIFRLLIKEVS